jgi:hypothetical protein
MLQQQPQGELNVSGLSYLRQIGEKIYA